MRVLPFLVAAAMPLAAVPAAAAVTFGDVLIEVRSTFNGFTVIEDADSGVVAPDDPQIFTSLIQPAGLARFPTSPSALPRGFASATFTALKLGGVGVSGVALNRFQAEGFALYQQVIFNDDQTEFAPLVIEYLIPNLEASVWAVDQIPEGPLALIEAELRVISFDKDNQVLEASSLFNYSLAVKTVSFGIVDTEISGDLVAERVGILFEDGDVQGVRYAAFESSRPLPLISPGGRLEIDYTLTAFGSTSTPETGYQAFIGDPFDFSGSGSPFRFRPGGAIDPIPEPSTWAMLIAGFAAVGLTARRRNAAVLA